MVTVEVHVQMYQFNRCTDQSTVRCSGNTDELQFIFTFGQNTTLQKKMKAKKKKRKGKRKTCVCSYLTFPADRP